MVAESVADGIGRSQKLCVSKMYRITLLVSRISCSQIFENVAVSVMHVLDKYLNVKFNVFSLPFETNMSEETYLNP